MEQDIIFLIVVSLETFVYVVGCLKKHSGLIAGYRPFVDSVIAALMAVVVCIFSNIILHELGVSGYLWSLVIFTPAVVFAVRLMVREV
jgi:RNase P/RNase MRP subunit POP5